MLYFLFVGFSPTTSSKSMIIFAMYKSSLLEQLWYVTRGFCKLSTHLLNRCSISVLQSCTKCDRGESCCEVWCCYVLGCIMHNIKPSFWWLEEVLLFRLWVNPSTFPCPTISSYAKPTLWSSYLSITFNQVEGHKVIKFKVHEFITFIISKMWLWQLRPWKEG